MNEAIRMAIESIHNGGLPFGAALLTEDYELIHSAGNMVIQYKNPSLHAERVLLKEIEVNEVAVDFDSAILVTTCEPCTHCFQVAYDLGIRTFIYGSSIDTSLKYFPSDEHVHIEYLKDDIIALQSNEDECNALFELHKDLTMPIPVVHRSEGSITEKYWMEVALQIARRGMIEAGEIPVGVILVQENGFNDEELLTESWTMTVTTNSPIVHGDVNAIMLAERKTYDSGKPTTMYSTLEPHLVGFGAALKARLRKVVYGLEAPEDGGSIFFAHDSKSAERVPMIVGGVYHRKQYELLLEFMEREKDNPNRLGYPYVKGLVEYYEKHYEV